MKQIDFMEIQGIKVGHAQNLKAATGCTVIICEKGATVGVDVRGGAPGTRETDLLNPVNLVQKAHAILLTGGSAFGLDSAAGVMQYLEENNIGFDVQVTKVPIVCGAALFDLAIGDHKVRPDKEMGYQACLTANSIECKQGCVGAGTGATVGKILGVKQAMKSGLGCYAIQAGDLKIGALVAVNCLGDIIDPLTNKKLASMAQNGYARAMRPAHTMYDGDTIFAMATGEIKAGLSTVGLLSARVMERAVVEAVKNAEPLFGIKSYSYLKGDGHENI